MFGAVFNEDIFHCNEYSPAFWKIFIRQMLQLIISLVGLMFRSQVMAALVLILVNRFWVAIFITTLRGVLEKTSIMIL
ncbi:hypothetical protein EE530_11620 [Salmonella enterica]|nr:hypothetical protein [Salmonella enterica]EAU5290300.1 hypothetical protein [Salmonella enterica]ECE5924720.1 hypothetical protein [Salmonella enterica subsp. houtenae]ECS8284498.1 hypothetical protein [Salmonella enterica]MIG12487.1 hypothetical protein [Salmonella enterica subsp. houtenae]